MDEQQAIKLLDQLRNGEVTECKISKNDFLLFRNELMKQDDVKSFRGNAQQGGDVIFTYEPNWTS